MGKKDLDTSMRRPPEDDPEAIDNFVKGSTDTDTDSDSEESENDQADEESKGTQRIAVYFDKSTAKRLRMYAAEQERPMSRIVDEIVAGELEGWTPDF